MLRVRNTYAGKSVLVTGASGFLGKAIVEKLLRDVKDVKSIYFFLRPKRGQNFEQRLSLMKNEDLFQTIREKQPGVLDKLRPIQADLSIVKNFGISDHDMNMLKKDVNFVIHAAATVKFNAPLPDAIRTNTLGTREMIRISKTFENLEAFTYVSTAFSNCHRPTHSDVNEIIYDPAFDYQHVIDTVESGNSSEIEKKSKKALKIFPNTYSLSKHLTEQMIKDLSIDFPVNIVRPSIITPTMKEPKEAWVSFNGTLMSLNLVMMTGYLRNLLAKKDTALDVIPCDTSANAIVTACAAMAANKSKDLQIYNCTMSMKNLASYEKIFGQLLVAAQTGRPSTKMIWYPRMKIHENQFSFWTHLMFSQIIPAALFDILSVVRLRKPINLMMQIKLANSLVFKYFSFNDWNFDNRNMLKLHDMLSSEEK